MPLDMPEVPMILTTIGDCKKRCSEQEGCGLVCLWCHTCSSDAALKETVHPRGFHFSFLVAPGLEQGSCHLAGFSALAQARQKQSTDEAASRHSRHPAIEALSPSWISGPPECWADMEAGLTGCAWACASSSIAQEKSLLIDKGHNTYVPCLLITRGEVWRVWSVSQIQ